MQFTFNNICIPMYMYAKLKWMIAISPFYVYCFQDDIYLVEPLLKNRLRHTLPPQSQTE